MVVIATVSPSPVLSLRFGLTATRAANDTFLGRIGPARKQRKRRRTAGDPVPSLAELRAVFVEARPAFGSVIGPLFQQPQPTDGSGLVRLGRDLMNPQVSGVMSWRTSACQIQVGGTPYLDSPADPIQTNLLLTNLGEKIVEYLAPTPDVLAFVDLGPVYPNAASLPLLRSAAMVVMVTSNETEQLVAAYNQLENLVAPVTGRDKMVLVVQGSASRTKPDDQFLTSQFDQTRLSLTVPYDPAGSHGHSETKNESDAVRTIRDWVVRLLESNPMLIGGNSWQSATTVR